MGIYVECAHSTGSLYLASLEPRLMLLLISHWVSFFPIRSPALYLDVGCPTASGKCTEFTNTCPWPSYLYLGKAWLTRATQLINIKDKNPGLPDFQNFPPLLHQPLFSK